MSWLCQCGNGDLCEETPPEFCGCCGFPLWEYFGINADELEAVE